MVSNIRRVRDVGITPGILSPGPRNDLTDVVGVRVGHRTVIDETAGYRTGVTVIRPHSENPYLHRVPAGLCVGNGHGKLAGGTQLQELGELETPIALVNTLSTGAAIEALVEWTLSQPGCEAVTSVNAVVGETNDFPLNNIRQRGIGKVDVMAALEAATTDPVVQGCVGAGTGTRAFGLKGGIGSSSRLVPVDGSEFCVAALVQSNFDGVLQIEGEAVGKAIGVHWSPENQHTSAGPGSVMIIVATDAPVSDRNLRRLATRAMAGLARTGANFANDSGDYAIAFSTHPEVRREPGSQTVSFRPELSNDAMSGLFLGAIEAVEEAIYNSLFAAEGAASADGREPVPSLFEATDGFSRPLSGRSKR